MTKQNKSFYKNTDSDSGIVRSRPLSKKKLFKELKIRQINKGTKEFKKFLEGWNLETPARGLVGVIRKEICRAAKESKKLWIAWDPEAPENGIVVDRTKKGMIKKAIKRLMIYD